jgi:hypothetical protein
MNWMIRAQDGIQVIFCEQALKALSYVRLASVTPKQKQKTHQFNIYTSEETTNNNYRRHSTHQFKQIELSITSIYASMEVENN